MSPRSHLATVTAAFLAMVITTLPFLSPLAAADPYLLPNIDPIALPADSTVGNYCVIGSTTFFTVFTPAIGTELWKTNGTTAGTVLVKDIFPGPTSSNPLHLCNMGGTLYFQANNGVNGEQLWRSNGTEAGTAMVKDIRPASLSASTNSFAVAGGKLYFQAYNSLGAELWISDGTELGTVLVKDINPGIASSNPRTFTPAAGTVYFVATDAENGDELWKTDGTESGTILVKDIRSGSATSSPSSLTAVGSTLYFTANTPDYGVELWKTDGTSSGTALVKDIRPSSTGSFPADLMVMNSTLYFNASNGSNGSELWKTDGTAAGTVMVTDLQPGQLDSKPFNLTVIGSTLYFTAAGAPSTPTNIELWKTDGTAAGTMLVKDINPGTTASDPASLTAIGSTLYFTAATATNGRELWKSDGTTAGTTLVKDILSGTAGALAFTQSLIAPVNNVACFLANDLISGNELWRSDGTESGTVLLRDFNPGGSFYVAALANTLYFSAALNGSADFELYKSDGTAAGTTLLKNIHPTSSSSPDSLTTAGDTLYFRANNGTQGVEVWRTDGTAAGTFLPAEIWPGSTHGSPFSLTAVNDQIYYFSPFFNGSGGALWKSGGLPNSVGFVKGTRVDSTNSITAVLGTVLFFHDYTFSAPELWRTGGSYFTASIADRFPFAAPPKELAIMGAHAYFVQDISVYGAELWKSNGGPFAGPQLVSDLRPGNFIGSNPAKLTTVGHRLYFTADDGVNGTELWRTEGFGAVMVKDFTPGPTGSTLENLTAAGNTLYFVHGDSTTGLELWKTGISTPTALVKDICPGSQSSHITNITALGNLILFQADDGTHGKELWQSDGTAAGTVLVKDLVPGSAGSTPANMYQFGSRLYFTAGADGEKHQLWAYDLPADTTPPTGGFMSLVYSPVDAGATFHVAFSNWVDAASSPSSLTYSFMLDNVPIGTQNNATFRKLVAPATSGVYTIKGRIYDAVNNYTEVTETLTVLSPLQSWRRTHFNTIDNSGDAADTADFDKDGISNLLEWATLLNPKQPSAYPSGLLIYSAFNPMMLYYYDRNKAAVDAGFIYTVEWSDTLLPGSWSSEGVVPVMIGNEPGPKQTPINHVPRGTLGRRFVRLKVTAP